MSETSRQNKIFIAVGGRGTGKTTYLKTIADNHNSKKVLVYDTDDNKKWNYPYISVEQLAFWKSGKYKLIDANSENVLNEINNHIKDTFLFIEDATKYINSSISKSLKNFLLASKQRNVDVIITYHSFRRIPPDLLNFTNGLIIFKTNEDIREFKSKIPNFELVSEIYTQVQQHKSRYFYQVILIN